MNILTYDETIDIYQLIALRDHLMEEFPEQEFLFVPKGIEWMGEGSAEYLFDLIDKLSVAVLKIKEERPEEYAEAEKNRITAIRDKQWEEALKRQNETYHKRNCKNNNV